MSNWKFKKNWKTYFYTLFYYFLGEHSNVNNVITALLWLCSCFYVLCTMYRYSWLITFEIFRNFFFLDRGVVGGVYRIQTSFGFLCFFYIYKAPYPLQRILLLPFALTVWVFQVSGPNARTMTIWSTFSDTK